MATTKIKAINDSLKRVINYVLNPEKCGHTSVINCTNTDLAHKEMMSTKERWDKKYGIQGYHLIQSFKPNETTPEQAHQVGIELCKRVLSDYQVVISTHIDCNHLHNHVVFNSVSFKDGYKYYDGRTDCGRFAGEKECVTGIVKAR